MHGIFLQPEDYNGKLVQGVSDIKSFDDVVESFQTGKLPPHRMDLVLKPVSTATGKKARFEEIRNWRDIEVYGIRSLETIKRMFGFCQDSGGRYYGDETEVVTAAELKKLAAEACGASSERAELSTLGKFFQKAVS